MSRSGPDSRSAPSTSCRVLVVEDSPMQRLNAAEGLRAAGFEVVEAAGIDAAIAALDQDRGVDVMISDVDLVGEMMTGMMLARAVAARWPETAILVVSGMIRPAEDHFPAGACFLPKPYTEPQLANAVASLLKSRAGDVDGMSETSP